MPGCFVLFQAIDMENREIKGMHCKEEVPGIYI